MAAVASPGHFAGGPCEHGAIGPSNDACPGRRLDGRHQGCPIGGLASVDWLRVAQLDAAHPVSLPVVGNQQVVIGAIPEPDRRILGGGDGARNLDDPLMLD